MTRVVWMNLNPRADARGAWDQGVVEELTAGSEYEHHIWGADGSSNTAPLGTEGGIFVIPGQHNLGDHARIIADAIVRQPWGLIVVTSDEEALFPAEVLPTGPRFSTFGQYHARPEFDRVIPIGAQPGTEQILAQIEATHPARMGDVFFAGQDTHSRRHELLDVMKEMACDPKRYGNVTWAATTGFRQGLSQDRYLAGMRDARIAPCPSGPHSLDSFRLYEALAAGCLPVIEQRTPHGDEVEFWDVMFGDDWPLPEVYSWQSLPRLLDQVAEYGWYEQRDEVRRWWHRWRAGLVRDFAATIARLQS